MGSLGNAELDRVVVRDAIGELAAGTTGVRNYGPNGEARQDEVKVFIESFAPPPQMLIFGAVDFTAALSRVAKVLGYRVTVCDARPVFATTQRFPYADEVVVDWPHRLLEKVGPSLGPRDAVCVLTHDPKFDVPAVIGALGTEVGYLGAMGSRRTTTDRNERLIAQGVAEADLARVMAPIGLDLGARTPRRRPSPSAPRSSRSARVGSRPRCATPAATSTTEDDRRPVTIGAAILAAGRGSRFEGDDHKLRVAFRGRPVVAWVLDEVLAAGFDEVMVITGAVDLTDIVGERARLIHNPRLGLRAGLVAPGCGGRRPRCRPRRPRHRPRRSAAGPRLGLANGRRLRRPDRHRVVRGAGPAAGETGAIGVGRAPDHR